MEILKKHLFLILAIAVTFFAIFALLKPGFFPIHDDEQIARLFELNYSLSSGHIPPRISQNLGFGYGYPFFNFYPSSAYYFAEIFVILGFSYITSTKLMIAAGFIFAAAFMYLFSKEYLGKIGAFIGAVLYTYAPYHSIDVYVRGALAEFWSFVFVPGVFLGVLRLSKNQTYPNVVIFALFSAGLILSHNLIAMMSLPFITAFFFYLLYINKNRKAFFVSAILGGMLGLLLSSYFWIPALLENKFTMVNLLTNELASYGLHFVSLHQFINSPWGYGGSILGPMDGLSLEIGKIHLILFAVSLVLILYNLIRAKTKHNIFLIFIIMFLFSIFIQSYYSKVIWDLIPQFSYIQFPWRFMIFSVFTASFLGGYIFSLKFNKKVKYLAAAVLVIIILLFYAPLFRPSEYLTNAEDEDYTAREFIRWETSIKAFEYVPAGVATKKSDLDTTVVDITKDEIAKETATALSGGIAIKVIEDKPHYKKMEVESVIGGKIQINTYSFPVWKIFIDGKEISYNDENKLKLITINVPGGKSLVEVKFTNTKIRNLANVLTVLGALLLFVFTFNFSKKIKL